MKPARTIASPLIALALSFYCLAAEQPADLDKLIARADAAGEQKAELPRLRKPRLNISYN